MDEILVGAERAPNVQGLGLEATSVEYDVKKGVRVNDRLQTTNRRIYAAGDICFPHQFTHTADATARIVIQNALFLGRARANALTIPWCSYTDPEIAHVGLYGGDAVERGIPVQTFTLELANVDRAVLDGQEQGFLKIHVKKGTNKILGATLVAGTRANDFREHPCHDGGRRTGEDRPDNPPLSYASGGHQKGCRRLQPHPPDAARPYSIF